MSRGPQASPENFTAYKNLAGDLITSMQADLYRVGLADSGQFRSLSDSVLDDLGGSGGGSANPDPSKMKEHVARMRRLIENYQNAMKNAANRL
jgi:hypothetical protein